MKQDDRQLIRSKVMQSIDMSGDIGDEQVSDMIDRCILESESGNVLSVRDKLALKKELFNSLRRLDILSELLDDEAVTEIMINGYSNIFVERAGRMYRYDKAFESEERLKTIIQSIVAECNRIVNEASPIVDARLKDGSRVNVVLPPVALDGPVMTIRRFPKTPFHMDKLLELGSITQEAADFLRTLVEARYNIFISGGTGSGKTTFLNVLSNYIPATERIVTIEDSAELQIRNVANLVRLETRNANLEGKNAVTIRDLVRSALRQRPDRIIIGEIRDAAVIELLSAMNTGHDGSISTGHANSPADMLRRMETLVLTGMEIPLAAVRSQIASAIEIVVQLGRLRDKSRKVLEIDEVCGIDQGEIVLRPLYQFRETENSTRERVEGRLMTTGNSLLNRRKLVMAGKERAVEIS